MPIQNGDVVKVHYSGFLEDGQIFDSSLDLEPLEFEIGSGMIIPGLERAIVGREKGDSFKVSVPPEEAYGLEDDSLVFEIPAHRLPSHITPEEGLVLQLATDQGEIDVRVTEFDDKRIVVDANHPLAGQTLIFEIEIVGVTSARD